MKTLDPEDLDLKELAMSEMSPGTLSGISRRDFLAGVTAAAGVASLGARLAPAAEKAAVKRGSDLVTLGRTGLKPTLLGIGTGTVGGSQQRNMGQDSFTKFVRYALERGIRYVDTADAYKTHSFVKNALDGVPRDKYFIQTKSGAKTADKMKADIDRFLKELNVEYVDTLLMHCMSKGSWAAEMRPVMDVLREAKEKGKIRALGCSCHGFDPLKASVDVKELDVQLVRINPFGVKAMMDAAPEDVAPLVKKMHDQGRGTIGMKIYGENGLGSKERRLESLKYVLGLGTVDCFTIGFTSTAQLDETLELIEQAST